MGWIMGNQSGPSRQRMSGKGMREVEEEGGGTKSGRKGCRGKWSSGIYQPLDLHVQDGVGGRDGEMDLGREGGHLYMMAE